MTLNAPDNVYVPTRSTAVNACDRTLLCCVLLGLVVAGCRKHGEHASTAHMCVEPAEAVPAFIDETDQQLRVRLTSAGFVPCAGRARTFQRGAHPVARFCGRLGDAIVEASINRPG